MWASQWVQGSLRLSLYGRDLVTPGDSMEDGHQHAQCVTL
jgi:hypothetical protein